MKLTYRPGRRLAAGIALACSAILLPAAALASSAAPGTPANPAAAALPSARPSASAATHPQQRQLAVTTLSWFKVVLTATREPGPEPGENVNATITAAGYRHTARGWKLIATKRIGRARGWAWYATDVCSLTVTQLKPGPPSGSPAAVRWDSITVSLLWGPAIGCLRPYTERWRP
jgi:hypothetical protein